MANRPGVPSPNITPYIGPVLARHRAVEYRELGARNLLNRLSGSTMPFGWTVNPFRGCQVGCAYCYARDTHQYLGHADPKEFEQTIYVKRADARSLLSAFQRARASGLEVAVGTATDPYQPAEAKFEITRQVLEVARQLPGLRLSITTKSALVTRDRDLLSEIALRSRLRVNFSIITLDADLARRLEPLAPRPALRFRAMATLARAGVPTRLFIMPVLPGLTDGDGTLRALMEAAREAGCREARWNPLFLRPGVRELFLAWITKEFPWLAERYQKLYARSAYVPREYRDELERRILAHARAAGLAPPRGEADAEKPRQLALVW